MKKEDLKQPKRYLQDIYITARFCLVFVYFRLQIFSVIKCNRKWNLAFFVNAKNWRNLKLQDPTILFPKLKPDTLNLLT